MSDYLLLGFYVAFAIAQVGIAQVGLAIYNFAAKKKWRWFQVLIPLWTAIGFTIFILIMTSIILKDFFEACG